MAHPFGQGAIGADRVGKLIELQQGMGQSTANLDQRLAHVRSVQASQERESVGEGVAQVMKYSKWQPAETLDGHHQG
ncbi:hypothetical protein D3C76_1000180 [compost metagenome]